MVSELKSLIKCKDDSFAQEMGFENAESVKFACEDWYQDVDGINIGFLAKTEKITDIIKKYYISNSEENNRKNRYKMLAKNLIVTENPDINSDLYKLTYSFVHCDQKYTDIFQLFFGNFDEEKWAGPLSLAFTEKFTEHYFGNQI